MIPDVCTLRGAVDANAEHAQRAGMLSYLLRGLGQQPSRLRVASFGNTSIVAGISRLMHAWRQPKITGGHIAIGKSPPVT